MILNPYVNFLSVTGYDDIVTCITAMSAKTNVGVITNDNYADLWVSDLNPTHSNAVRGIFRANLEKIRDQNGYVLHRIQFCHIKPDDRINIRVDYNFRVNVIILP